MANAYWFGGIYDLLGTRLSAATPAGIWAHHRTPTDPIYSTDLKLVSLQTGFSFNVQDKDDVTLVNGDYTVNPTYYNDVAAYTETDDITVYFLKYGNEYKEAGFILTPVETLLFMGHTVNSNITLSEAAAAALTGIAVDKVLKTVTVSTSHSQSEVYDYLQWYQAQSGNVDLLPDGEIFSTILGTTFTLKADWSLIFTVAPAGAWDVVSSNITIGALFDFSDLDVTGTVYFDVAGTYTITDSEIDTVDGDETVVINPLGTTSIGANADPTNITIDTPVATLTITDLQIGSDVVIIEAGTNNVLSSVDQTIGTTFEYILPNTNPIDIGVIKVGYITKYIYGYTPQATNATLPMKQIVDRNYI